MFFAHCHPLVLFLLILFFWPLSLDTIYRPSQLATAAREAKQQLQLLDAKMASLARNGIYV